MKVHILDIAGLSLQIRYESAHPALMAIFDFLDTGHYEPLATVEVHDAPANQKVLSYNWQCLQIFLQNNPHTYEFQYYGLVQALLRFAGIHSPQINKYLLHGSCVWVQGFGGVLFADDDGLDPFSRSVKTSPSLEMALAGASYTGDEFVFFTPSTLTIHGFSGVPIHIRQPEITHFRQVHSIPLNPDSMLCYARDFGLATSETVPLALVLFCHSAKSEDVIKLTGNNLKSSLATTFVAHLAKFLDPSLDRFRFDQQVDHAEATNINKVAEKVFAQFHGLKDVVHSAEAIPSYRMDITDRCSISSKVQALLLTELNREIATHG